MRTFRALVVDDQPAIHRLARETADPAKGIKVHSARSLEDADALLAEHFFHVAVVDIQLVKGSKRNVDGQTVLRMLADTRPTCRRLLLTQYPQVYRPEIFRMLDPDARIIDGAVDKDDLAHFFVDYVESDATQWLHAPVDVTGLDTIYHRLQSKRINGDTTLAGRRVVTTPEELDYVVSRLFGQGLKHNADEVDASGNADDITAIALELLEGGKSRSVVAAGRPVNRVGHEGIHCVIKVGPRADTLEELRRYDRYVRFRLSLHRRVEMLGHAVADTIGAICYSFAGKSPNDITDMHSLFDAEDPRANDMLAVLFGDEADWQPDGERARNLAGFFNRSYGLDALRVVKDVHAFAKANADDFSAQKTDDALVFAGGRIELPTDGNLGSERVHCSYCQAIVHGDLNASNVIVSSTNDVTLIDFRHTTRGPVALDVAALQASIRLSPRSWAGAAGKAVQDAAIEQRLWAHDFATSDDWWPREAPSPPPYWATVAAALMATAARTIHVSTEEYAVTSLLYAMRVFRVTTLDRQARLRLLVWMSALQGVLAALPDDDADVVSVG